MNTGWYRFPKILAELRAPKFGARSLKKSSQSSRKIWSKRRGVCLAPFRHSGTKIRVIGLENFRVEWVLVNYCAVTCTIKCIFR